LFQQLDDTIALHQRKLDLLTQLKQGYLEIMFPQKGEKKPKLRFADFDGNWEQRKVNQIGSSYYGGGTPITTKNEYWGGSLPWIQSSDIHEHILHINKTNKTVTEAGLKNSATKLIPANSIAIVTRVGVGKLALIPYDYSTSQDFFSIS